MNHKKIIIGLLIAIVVAVVILFSISAAKAKKAKEAKEKEAAQPQNSGIVPPAKIETPAALASDYPIVYMKYSAAAKKLQAAVGTTQDGVVGDKTLAAWNAILTKASRRNADKSFVIESERVLNTLIDEIKDAKIKQTVAQGAAAAIVRGWFAQIPALKIV